MVPADGQERPEVTGEETDETEAEVVEPYDL